MSKSYNQQYTKRDKNIKSIKIEKKIEHIEECQQRRVKRKFNYVHAKNSCYK